VAHWGCGSENVTIVQGGSVFGFCLELGVVLGFRNDFVGRCALWAAFLPGGGGLVAEYLHSL